jgi:hypothetical protein
MEQDEQDQEDLFSRQDEEFLILSILKNPAYPVLFFMVADFSGIPEEVPE